MRLSDLPTELVLQVADRLEYERDLNSFAQTSRRFYQCLNTFLYQYAMKTFPYEALHRQVALNSLSAVKKSFRFAEFVPQQFSHLSYLLDFAMSKGHCDMTKLLVKEGVPPESNPDADDRVSSYLWSYKAYHEMESCACRLNFTQAIKRRFVDMIPWIIAQHEEWPLEAVLGHARMAVVHADLEMLKFIDQEFAKSPCWQSKDMSPIQAAMEASEDDTNPTRSFDQTLLQEAIGTEDWSIVEYLIALGANVNYHAVGRPALEMTILQGNLKIIRLLQQKNAHAYCHIPDDDNLLRLMCAAVSEAKTPELTITELRSQVDVDKIMANPGKDLNTLLLIAASCGLVDLTKSILDKGGDPNAEPARSPLAMAARRGHLEIATILLKDNAYVNGNSNPGHTEPTHRPLYEACANGHVDVVELLLKRGACATSRHLDTMFAGQPAIRVPRILELLILQRQIFQNRMEWTSMVKDVIRSGNTGSLRVMIKHKVLYRRGLHLVWHDALAGGVDMLELIGEYLGGFPNDQTDPRGAMEWAIKRGYTKEALFFYKAGLQPWPVLEGEYSKFEYCWIHIELARAAVMSDKETFNLLLGDENYAELEITDAPGGWGSSGLELLPNVIYEVFELGPIRDTGSFTEMQYYQNLLRLALMQCNSIIFDQVIRHMRARAKSTVEVDRILASIYGAPCGRLEWELRGCLRALEAAYWRVKYPVDSLPEDQST